MTDCTGACCAVFYLSEHRDTREEWPTRIKDGEFIADMVIPLTWPEARKRAERFGNTFTDAGRRSAGHLYTCRHWDEETRLCKSYETRPGLCRNYPYGDPCSLGQGCQAGCCATELSEDSAE